MKTYTYDLGLFLFHRDLRIVDNNALEIAYQECRKIIPIFIFTNTQIKNSLNPYKSMKSVQCMIESLDDLQQYIEKQNGECYFMYGENTIVLKKLLDTLPIQALYFNDDYTPYAKQRDKQIIELCKKKGIECIHTHDVSLYEPGKIRTGSGEYFQKFTPYYNQALKHSIQQPKQQHSFSWFVLTPQQRKQLKTISLHDAYIEYTEPSATSLLYGGREQALKVLNEIEKGEFKHYEKERNTLTYNTTQLSAYLKFGCVSTREVYYSMKKSLNSQALIRQLIWRDFYLQLVDGFPHVLQGKSLKPKYDKIVWNKNKQWFDAWCKGETGFPIVDACMRQLNTTGYMHNRGRLIVSGFLVKIMGIDWRWGEKYFAQQLIDYDPASNNGNWQWTAGSGADSQPYFRILNPWTQGEKHDPNGEYIKQWIPELSEVEPKHLHSWDTFYNLEEYKNLQYPKPILEYGKQREIVLSMYKKYL